MTNSTLINRAQQWMAMEQFRLDCVRQWPDSTRKHATLAAIQSSLEMLKATICPPIAHLSAVNQ